MSEQSDIKKQLAVIKTNKTVICSTVHKILLLVAAKGSCSCVLCIYECICKEESVFIVMCCSLVSDDVCYQHTQLYIQSIIIIIIHTKHAY